MKSFSLLIKPASADCNLRCEYCFYLDRSRLYPGTAQHRMSEAVLDRMISRYMATSQPQYAFGWQGGEPTLMGVGFFREVVELQKKYGRPGATVANGLQTNAVLIDDELAAHLAKYNFLLGVSIDGPDHIHDRYRRNAAGRGSHADVLRGIECLKRNRVEFNALVLVSAANVERAPEIYQYVCDLGILHHQYIPCVEFVGNGRLLPYAISGRQWGEFLCGIYDQWLPGDTRKVSVRLFDSILTRLVEGTYSICHMGRNCCQYFVIEHNGDVYPCDFFVRADLKLGNVADDSWEALQQSPKYLEFGRQKAQWNERCGDCAFIDYCSADCLKHRLPCGGDNPQTLSWLCEGWRQFYSHALPGFKRLAKEIKEERERDRQQMLDRRGMQSNPATGAPGRNAPCPCGSGRKYKKCCGT